MRLNISVAIRVRNLGQNIETQVNLNYVGERHKHVNRARSSMYYIHVYIMESAMVGKCRTFPPFLFISVKFLKQTKPVEVERLLPLA